MQHALPNPRQAIAIPLLTLVMGAAGGATVAALIAGEAGVPLPSAKTANLSSGPSQARPVEGAAVSSMTFGSQTIGLSEKAADPSLTWPSVPPGLSEKSTDPGITR
jgi:hypothetical protein